MIVQRFRPIGMVAGVAVAATGLYLVSLKVAAERGRVEAVDRQIANVRHDLFALQTELGTRASLRQLEKWNGEVLALSAPTASQFVHDEAQLATLDASMLPTHGNAAPAVMVASFTPPAVAASAPPAVTLAAATIAAPGRAAADIVPAAKLASTKPRVAVPALAVKVASATVKQVKVAKSAKPAIAPQPINRPLQRAGYELVAATPHLQRVALVRGQ